MKQFSAFLLLLFLFTALSSCAREAEAPGLEVTEMPVAAETPVATDTPAATNTPAPTNTALPTETPAPTATATAPAPTEAPPSPTPTAEPEPGAVEIEEDEAILILSPGNGSRVTGPLRVTGQADPTFEQALAVRVIGMDGEQLALQPATIAASLGERGPFEVQVPLEVPAEQQVWIQVYATSARDGGITHLASVAVTLAPSGEEELVTAAPHPERIVIDEPAMGDAVSGGVVRFSGRALASFEQTLVAELLDDAGNIIAQETLIVDAPDLGQPGTFEGELSYDIAEAMPARLQVRDPSPAFEGDVHLASVELMLEP